MKLQKLLSYTRRAVDDYDMIKPGDKIAIGISGGKDSLALLYALHGLRRFYKHSFDIHAITIDMGFDNVDFSAIQLLCQSLDIPYTVINTQIKQVVFDHRKEKNPCGLCSKMRRGALNGAAKDLGCSAIALGHNKDDIIETVFMTMFFEGRYYCFPPVTYMDRIGLFNIRPLIYVPEKEIRAFQRLQDLPVMKSSCPVDGNTQRAYIKNMIAQQSSQFPGLPDRLFSALQRSDVQGWKLSL